MRVNDVCVVRAATKNLRCSMIDAAEPVTPPWSEVDGWACVSREKYLEIVEYLNR